MLHQNKDSYVRPWSYINWLHITGAKIFQIFNVGNTTIFFHSYHFVGELNSAHLNTETSGLFYTKSSHTGWISAAVQVAGRLKMAVLFEKFVCVRKIYYLLFAI